MMYQIDISQADTGMTVSSFGFEFRTARMLAFRISGDGQIYVREGEQWAGAIKGTMGEDTGLILELVPTDEEVHAGNLDDGPTGSPAMAGTLEAVA